MIQHRITYFGQNLVVACDAKCSKAWGINKRPRVTVPDARDPDDDYAFLADQELGKAPRNPGTYEGGFGKPTGRDGGPSDGRLNKWCVRECERSEKFGLHDPVVLHDFSKRRYNDPKSDPDYVP